MKKKKNGDAQRQKGLAGNENWCVRWGDVTWGLSASSHWPALSSTLSSCHAIGLRSTDKRGSYRKGMQRGWASAAEILRSRAHSTRRQQGEQLPSSNATYPPIMACKVGTSLARGWCHQSGAIGQSFNPYPVKVVPSLLDYLFLWSRKLYLLFIFASKCRPFHRNSTKIKFLSLF